MKKKNHSPTNKLPALRSVGKTKDLGNERDGSRQRGTRHVAQQQQPQQPHSCYYGFNG